MILPSCNMKGCPEQRAGAEGARPGADVSVAHMPLGNIPLTFYLLSAPRLFTSFLPESHNFRNEKTHPKWRTGRRITWPPGAGPVALHAASVDGKQYRLMFMPYVLDLFMYQHQNPVSVQCNATRSYWEEGHSLIRQTAEKPRLTNEDWGRLTFTKQALALEGNKHYPAEVLPVS